MPPLLCSDGCFAVGVCAGRAYRWMLCHLSWLERMLCRCGSSSPWWMLCRWGSWCCDGDCATIVSLRSFLQDSVVAVVWVSLVSGWSVLSSPYCLLLSVLSFCVLACVWFFQCFFVFSPLCFCVGQALSGHIRILSVIAFFLMKNVLRHGREKKSKYYYFYYIISGIPKNLLI